MIYIALANEVWIEAAEGHRHLAVVVRPVDGRLDAKANAMARVVAKALNDWDAGERVEGSDET